MQSAASIDVSEFQLAPHLVGEDAEDTEQLRTMAREAETYIASHHWAPPIDQLLLGYGLGGVLALFLAKFAELLPSGEDCLWVVVGDLPSAYFVVDAAHNARDALSVYCELMDDWADRVLAKGDLGEAFPVEAAPTEEHAQMLKSRLQFIREKVIPIV